MKHDAIIRDVRFNREAIAREHDYDLESIFRMLVDAERKSQLATNHQSPLKSILQRRQPNWALHQTKTSVRSAFAGERRYAR
jgi:hypothetical protein